MSKHKHTGLLLHMILLSIVALLFSGCAQTAKIKRVGSVIGIKKDKIPEYKELHRNTWPGVLKMINKANIRNYSIYLAEVEQDKYYLFSYFEYVGDDFETDMAAPFLDGPGGNEIRAQSPLNRAGRPEEIASLCAFLASEQTEYMTGCVIDINGASYLRT